MFIVRWYMVHYKYNVRIIDLLLCDMDIKYDEVVYMILTVRHIGDDTKKSVNWKIYQMGSHTFVGGQEINGLLY